MALAHRKPDGELLHHSDRGAPYGNDALHTLLGEDNIQPSMSRKGNGWGYAAAEGFFGIMNSATGDSPANADDGPGGVAWALGRGSQGGAAAFVASPVHPSIVGEPRAVPVGWIGKKYAGGGKGLGVLGGRPKAR